VEACPTLVALAPQAGEDKAGDERGTEEPTDCKDVRLRGFFLSRLRPMVR